MEACYCDPERKSILGYSENRKIQSRQTTVAMDIIKLNYIDTKLRE